MLLLGVARAVGALGRVSVCFGFVLDLGCFRGMERLARALKLSCYFRFSSSLEGGMAYGFEEVRQVTDVELVSRLERLVRADRLLGARLLVHLGELEERRLYLERGYSSMYDYCRNALRMSDGEAYLRIQAARSARQFPLVLERLEAGAVHLSGIKLLAMRLALGSPRRPPGRIGAALSMLKDRCAARSHLAAHPACAALRDGKRRHDNQPCALRGSFMTQK